ncbi:MAG TPA: hypothetical protein VHX16_18435, partial [Chloroflexota bacterium]|nr:hypothetical protein [Chloroflexota bacterium]
RLRSSGPRAQPSLASEGVRLEMTACDLLLGKAHNLLIRASDGYALIALPLSGPAGIVEQSGRGAFQLRPWHSP